MRNELSGENVRIRRYRKDDAAALFEAATESIQEVYPWLPWCHPDYCVEESEEWTGMRDEVWNDGAAYEFVIEDVATGDFLGGCGISQIDRNHMRANLGYWVRTSATGRGIAAEAARLLARFGFEDIGLTRIEIIAAVENKASCRVAEKAGATFEGILRNRLLLHGKPHDAASYSLIP